MTHQLPLPHNAWWQEFMWACCLTYRSLWGAAGTQLCYVVLSEPQADDMADVVAVLSRWYLVVSRWYLVA